MAKKSFKQKCLTESGKILRYLEKEVKFQRDANSFSFRTGDVKARVDRINGGYRGSAKEYRDIIVSYWKKYGIKPQKVWYDLYCDGMEAYDPRFIPDSVWFHDILPYYNSAIMVSAYSDKAIYSWLLPNVKKPDTVVKRIAGYFYDGDGEKLITREEAERICESEEHLIIKPSNGTKGAGILFYDRDDNNGKTVAELFDAMSSGFVVQRIVNQHADLARLNPGTLNTIRLISFHFNNEVHILSALLRIGGSGSRVDNVSAGGSACAVYPTGWLHEKSVNRQSVWTDKTATGIEYSSVQVPSYNGIKETIKNLHCQLPYFNIVGWDFAVDESGVPVFIEFNTKPGQNQISCGPTFGDLTETVLEDVFIKKSLKNAFVR